MGNEVFTSLQEAGGREKRVHVENDRNGEPCDVSINEKERWEDWLKNGDLKVTKDLTWKIPLKRREDLMVLEKSVELHNSGKILLSKALKPFGCFSNALLSFLDECVIVLSDYDDDDDDDGNINNDDNDDDNDAINGDDDNDNNHHVNDNRGASSSTGIKNEQDKTTTSNITTTTVSYTNERNWKSLKKSSHMQTIVDHRAKYIKKIRSSESQLKNLTKLFNTSNQFKYDSLGGDDNDHGDDNHIDNTNGSICDDMNDEDIDDVDNDLLALLDQWNTKENNGQILNDDNDDDWKNHNLVLVQTVVDKDFEGEYRLSKLKVLLPPDYQLILNSYFAVSQIMICFDQKESKNRQEQIRCRLLHNHFPPILLKLSISLVTVGEDPFIQQQSNYQNRRISAKCSPYYRVHVSTRMYCDRSPPIVDFYDVIFNPLNKLDLDWLCVSMKDQQYVKGHIFSKTIPECLNYLPYSISCSFNLIRRKKQEATRTAKSSHKLSFISSKKGTSKEIDESFVMEYASLQKIHFITPWSIMKREKSDMVLKTQYHKLFWISHTTYLQFTDCSITLLPSAQHIKGGKYNHSKTKINQINVRLVDLEGFREFELGATPKQLQNDKVIRLQYFTKDTYETMNHLLQTFGLTPHFQRASVLSRSFTKIPITENTNLQKTVQSNASDEWVWNGSRKDPLMVGGLVQVTEMIFDLSDAKLVIHGTVQDNVKKRVWALSVWILNFCRLPQLLIEGQAVSIYFEVSPSQISFRHDLWTRFTEHEFSDCQIIIAKE